MLHIPILRFGEPYRSLDVAKTPDFKTKQPYVELSMANPGVIRRDLLQQQRGKDALTKLSTAELIAICKTAADYFLNGTLTIGDQSQTPDEYVRQLSATTGMPHVMVRKNMNKIHGVLDKMTDVLDGLTRGVEFEVLDKGFGMHAGFALSFVPRAAALGVVLPNNSPGVHSLWAPAVAMKTALFLKPGSAEPWTPYRMIQALIKAGAPKEAFGYYPCDHAGAGEILRHCGRGMVFGDVSATKKYENDPRIEVHGPGYSKIVFGEDQADNWEKYLDVMVASISENSGRSCVNASGVWTPRNGKQIAEALAERLAKLTPKPADDPKAPLAPFADPRIAERISGIIDADLGTPGARDVTAQYRSGGRCVELDSSTYLLPTVVECASDHALANREFLFPFVSVVETPESTLPEILGPSLVLTAITENKALRERLLASPHVGRLNFGGIPTMQISWDQPHEGNLFDHLYGRRAFQMAG
ncbi:MAG: aldehyde dehydrogenase family protein [Bryobacteraceae bacterium]